MAEQDGRVLGFAYCQWFKPRPAYRYSAEDSIYLHPDAAGQGLGRQLLTALAHQAEAAGIRKLIAVIGDSGNAGSIGVHRALGFHHVGTIQSVRLEVRPLAGHRADGEEPRRGRQHPAGGRASVFRAFANSTSSSRLLPASASCARSS